MVKGEQVNLTLQCQRKQTGEEQIKTMIYVAGT